MGYVRNKKTCTHGVFNLNQKMLLLASLVWYALVVEGWILRLPCKKEADFNLAVNDYALENSIVGKYTVSYLGRCTEECMANYQCRSMNYKDSGANNCELNAKIRQNSLIGNFVKREGWIYIATDHETKQIGSVCESLNPCKSGSYCKDTCIFPHYQCITCGTNYEFSYDEVCKIKASTVNLALAKPAMQSSVHVNRNNIPLGASRAVDGLLPRLCAVTGKHANQWWRVDLQARALVQVVSVENRGHYVWFRTNPFHINVGDSLNNEGRSNPICFSPAVFDFASQFKRFPCPPATYGRYVVIHIKERTEYLELCQVEVFGFFNF